jgi:hypothetical protein
MTAGADVIPAPAMEALLARVRARLERTRAHLRTALAGRDTDPLYSWGVYPEDGLTPVLVTPTEMPRDWVEARLGLNWRPPGAPRLKPASTSAHFVPASPQGLAYLTAMREWPLPPLEVWRTAYRQAYDRTGGDDPARFAAALDHQLREAGALEPEALPLRMTIAEGLARLDTDAERLTAATGAELLAGLALMPDELRAAVGAREELVTRWPWPWRSPAGRVLTILSALADTVPSGELAPGAWPAEVAPLDVATWAAPVLEKADPDTAAALRAMAEEWRATGRPERVSPRWTALAVLYAALQAVEKARRTPVIRHSATKAGRAALTVLAAGPGSIDTAHPWRPDMVLTGGVVELVWDGRRTPVQLRLDLTDDHARLDYVAVRGILRELHEDGLRDWLILHRMAGEQGASGTIRWTWADHKARTPYARHVTLGKATDADLAAATVARLWQLKRAEIRLYAPRALADGSTPWMRVGPGGLLDIPAGTIDPTGRDRLVVIKLNPEIYAGAKRHAPAPHFMLLAESAVNLPGDALRLVSFLACDWQYERTADGLIRDAATLWDYAAIRDGRNTPRKRWPEAERTLERLLATLAAQGHLADWHHEGGEGAARQYHLRPPQWWIDQAILDVPPVFGKSLATTPKTGRELKTWRHRHGWSERELAKLAAVTRATITRAENAPTKPLSPRLVARLRPL